MFGFRSLAISSVAAVLLATGAPAAQAAALTFAPTGDAATSSTGDGADSTDWSGWDVTGGTYTSVSASWTVPTVTCTTGETSYSANWVGLDGDGSDSVEQIGTSSDCDSGTPTYSSWYEFYPSASVNLTDTVEAGDKMSASVVAVKGSDRFTLVLTDATQKWSKTETGESPEGTGASAEVIAEAPSGAQGYDSVLPLADFRTTTFSDIKVNGGGLADIGGAQKIQMVDSSGGPMATVSALSGTRAADTFTVTWVSSGDDAYADQGSATGGFGSGGYGYGYGSGSDGYGYGAGSDGYGYGYGYGGDGSGTDGTGSLDDGWGDSTGEWGYSTGDGSGGWSYSYGSGDSFGDGTWQS